MSGIDQGSGHGMAAGELAYIEAILPALAVREDNAERQAVLKMNLASAMFRVRGEFVAGLADEIAEWIDRTAALTPPPAVDERGSIETQARGRYATARHCWSLVFSARLAQKGVRI